MNTYYPKTGDVQEKWYVVDAKGEVLGRLASRVAAILRGKNLPTFHPAVDPQAHVIVLNADKVILTGRKLQQKTYSSHSGYPGGYKEATAQELFNRKPTEVLRHAIKGMLPKGTLGATMLTHVRIYTDDKHTHQAQKPEVVSITKKRA
ncbi:50S ribosomal protein L13 [Candidatus Sumerlaeota bacterium]|nr:50S ribosomal protein L13 [Candidatus Sumerlaeota bacterium]